MEDKKKTELSDEILDQVAGGNEAANEESETRIMYCARECKCSREFRSDANGKWICTACGQYKGVINTFA